MGYTHYFTQKKECPPEAWQQICDAFKQLQVAALINHDPLLIQRVVSAEEIIFNGIKDEGHETMVLIRKQPGFACCKTARKPYDRVVVALLCLVEHFAPSVWDISSDGDEEDWQEGLALARTVVPNCPMVTFRH